MLLSTLLYWHHYPPPIPSCSRIGHMWPICFVMDVSSRKVHENFKEFHEEYGKVGSINGKNVCEGQMYWFHFWVLPEIWYCSEPYIGCKWRIWRCWKGTKGCRKNTHNEPNIKRHCQLVCSCEHQHYATLASISYESMLYTSK